MTTPTLPPLPTSPSTTPLAKLLWGEERLRRRCEILAAISTNPVFATDGRCNPHALSRKELWTLRLKQGVELLALKFKLGWSNQQFVDATKIAGDILSLGVNYRIFIRNLEAQMSAAQKAYWIPRAERFEIAGCYAQTELGHGSNVRGIETTATFDPSAEADEIVINSPTVSSHKYWIGSLGVVATHALVIARLVVKGQDLGNHVFLVQVRDLDTHDLMPGVQIYEQGEKGMGTFASMDNGVMAFTNCRIPRANMLAGMVSLERDGTYRAARNTKHAYTSMVIIRGLMSEEIGTEVAKAVVIALNYTGFRRQFNARDGQEKRVIEYASVQHRLFPALARAVAMMLLGREMRARIDNIVNESLEDLHLQTVGAKIWVSEHGVRDIEVARLSCGGHGNMAATGLGALYAQLSPSRTYEGETYVLSQQIGNAVVKHWKNKSESSINALSYLRRLRDHKILSQRTQVASVDAWSSPRVQEDFLELRAALLAKRHLDDVAGGRDTSYDVFELTMAHADLTYCRALQAQVKQSPNEDRPALEALANVFALTAIVENLAAFAGTELLSAEDLANLRLAHKAAISVFAREVERVVEAFGFTEYELNSVFARSSQTPYEGLLEVAKQSELTDNRFIRPTLLEARSLWKKYSRAKI
ncbi:putative peroxisomal acyl-coenzyme A oxidase 1.2 [Cladophialophora carrionii]|uniref:Acyl-coenzyme A oxidase n=1 Tax=Cladophialophora carrionii TaxID=86049 RepID=A0A1C1CXN0_9EURO|nr:putative peroxisomal acyl-coenzyme A oxidase 1.2 [Cladophialophora carrionii]